MGKLEAKRERMRGLVRKWKASGEPLSGHLFLFRNRRGDRLKILVWDRSGFWVLYKRLERGTFAWPTNAGGEAAELRSSELMLLLSGAEITHAARRRWYDAVKSNALDH